MARSKAGPAPPDRSTATPRTDAALDDIEAAVGTLEDRIDTVEAAWISGPTDDEIASLLERGDEAQAVYPPPLSPRRAIEEVPVEVVDAIVIDDPTGARQVRLIPTAQKARPSARPGCIRVEIWSGTHAPGSPPHLCKVLDLDAAVVTEQRAAVRRTIETVRALEVYDLARDASAQMRETGLLDESSGTVPEMFVEEALHRLAEKIGKALEDEVTRLFSYRIAQALIPNNTSEQRSEEGIEKP